MIRRHCPRCDIDWYSANTETWKCHTCGMPLGKEHEKPLDKQIERRDKHEA